MVMRVGDGRVASTESQLDDAQDASNTRHSRHPFSSHQSAVAQPNIATWPVDSKSRCIGGGGRGEDVGVGGDLDIYIPEWQGHAGQQGERADSSRLAAPDGLCLLEGLVGVGGCLFTEGLVRVAVRCVSLQGMRDENSVVANQVREVEAKCLDGDIYNHVALCCCPWARCRGKLST